MGLEGLDTKFINLFLTSVETTFVKVLQSDVVRGKVSLIHNMVSENNVAIFTGVIGDIHTGMVVYRMHSSTAQRMIDYLDPNSKNQSDRMMVYEGLGEVINIISGNTMSKFLENDIPLNITTPSIISGNAIELFMLNHNTLSVDMLLSFGTMQIDLAIKHF